MKFPPLGAYALFLLANAVQAAVRVEPVPEEGLQADAAAGPDGTVHLVFLRGEAKAAEVCYTWRRAGGPWQPAVTVSSSAEPGIAIGSIRGPQLALGAQGAVHILWNGASGPDKSKDPGLWYARKSVKGQSFSKPQNLMGTTLALDGGASLAADGHGRVEVVWHGQPAGEQPMETRRRVFVRTSLDEGHTFSGAAAANETRPGVCACCALKTTLGPGPGLNIFYRSAGTPENREMTLLSRTGAEWQTQTAGNWKTPVCPMSSAALVPWQNRLLGAWETAGQIHLQWLSGPASVPVTAAASDAKHPALSISPGGHILLAWVEGTGWNRGGMAVWQEFDSSLKPVGPRESAPGVPVWGRVAVYADPKGGFVLLK